MATSDLSSAGVVVVGGGFAGVWATIAATRRLAVRDGLHPSVVLVSRDPYLTIRPRLYEANPQQWRVPLASVLTPVHANICEAQVLSVDPVGKRLHLENRASDRFEMAYDRLVLATGSELRPLSVPGVGESSFNIDTYAAAQRLEEHLAELRLAPARPGRDTIVIVGAGFTGIELATEMRSRLARLWGEARATAARVILVQRLGTIGSDLGESLRPRIETALREQQIEIRLNTQLVRVAPEAVWFAGGERVAASTTIITAGMQASPLAKAVPGAIVDELGRLHVDKALRVQGVKDIYAAGDIARAYADEEHLARMSCQHAILMGEVAGHNAARDVLGLSPLPYRQPDYVTCLDLGPGNAIFSEGWDPVVRYTGSQGKEMKQQINSQWIYPPKGDRADIHEAIRVDLHRSEIHD